VAAAGLASAQAVKPNVVMILVDDMGYADIGSYGATDIRTPNLDRLRREGVKLTDFYSNGPVCTPTRAAFITGRYQQRVGLEWAIVSKDHESGLTTDQPSIARLLRGNGYATGIFGKWHLGYPTEFGPNAHGFDEFFGLKSGNHDFYSHVDQTGELDLYEQTAKVEKAGYTTDLITERSVDFIDRHAQRPFFAYVAYNAPHWPFQAPDRPEDVRNAKTWLNGNRKDYGLMIERIDQGVGRILDAVERHKLTRDTLVIFTNDNGGERYSSNVPLFHHKGTLFEGGIRVPCLIRWPARLRAGSESRIPAMTMDLTPTILAATGTAPSATHPPDGSDLLPILEGRAKPIARHMFWRIDRNDRRQKAVRYGEWKLVVDGNITLLFNIDEDMSERRDRGFERPELLGELRQRLDQWEKELAASPPRFTVK
jgi:arylsulfatase A